jgi:deoxyribodipyrimidine photo-lyase
MTLSSVTGSPPVIVWFRNDLRLEDNPALYHAAESPLLPLFIWDENDPRPPGGASRWWLNKSLGRLQESLKQRGLNLVLKKGRPLEIIQELARQTHATGLYWNHCYDPYSRQRDTLIQDSLSGTLTCHRFNGSFLCDPQTLLNQTGKPYQVFTPFWKALQQTVQRPQILPAPQYFQDGCPSSVESDTLESWGLHPKQPDWSGEFETVWQPGEAGAYARLETFLMTAVKNYKAERNIPGLEGTSRLSPHLHWGEISPQTVWARTLETVWSRNQGLDPDAWHFLSELAWREFSSYLLYHFPQLLHRPLREAFLAFPWREDPEGLGLWQKGLTGYPIVDAGMRQLWRTGWMHNRVRMIVASFLVKDLMVSWTEGEKWFWDTLVDGDHANNAASWQWVAGCGADAAPYFRIFNPVLQGEKFDPQGHYVRTWVPELALLPDSLIHCPWQASPSILQKIGITFGTTYPYPLVDHGVARKRALEALQSTSKPHPLGQNSPLF